MTKTKNKQQKRKFFGDIRNRGKVFKKNDAAHDQQRSQELRKRGNFTVISTEGMEVPSCAHGPCLLLGNLENGEVVNKFFTCAVYRLDEEKCSFKAVVDDAGNIGEQSDVMETIAPTEWKYNLIPKKIAKMKEESPVVWCTECFEVFETKHKHPAQFVARDMLKTPSKLLEPLESHTGEAQFFFSDETINVLTNLVKLSEADAVLCIGAPRLFETLKADSESNRKLFMLDYDKRYAPFYKSSEYAQYSMLTNHLYDENSVKKLSEFLESATRLLIVCDPPFGVFVEPLMKSIEALKNRFVEASTEAVPQCLGIVILPMFVGKRAIHFDNNYYMHDYRVTYNNHKIFSKQTKTTVRMFTNIPSAKVNLEGIEGYKFCDMCEYWVHNTNNHCFMCMKCTSKDGGTYWHCSRCMRCVKTSYKHCKKCERCHIPSRCRIVKVNDVSKRDQKMDHQDAIDQEFEEDYQDEMEEQEE